MALNIDWFYTLPYLITYLTPFRTKLSPSDEKMVEGFLNEKLASINRPSVVGEISVSGFSFGATPPEVKIMDTVVSLAYCHGDYS